jgi:hypothetical protein
MLLSRLKIQPLRAYGITKQPDLPHKMTFSDSSERPKAFFVLGLFFFFGSAMAVLAAVTLLDPGTVLDRAWALNPSAYKQMLPLGRIVGVPFLTLAVVLFLTGIGWLRRRYWGWVLAVSVIGTKLAADIIHVFIGDHLKSAVGVIIASLLLVYLSRPAVRNYFMPYSL